ncbi:ribonuclease Y [Kribbella solani]|uniref:Ribonuclease Y n=1 Tax=Kribbella solani TaxID=236067 RepID=A0A841DPS1_9ACTN|nr:ribonuclease Y [Kribbella solani]MBB5978925.1 ribonuclease Y [Kribbella solani]MDX2972033.1 ribonuclease Y [Kribbella solani]MDX3000354.1 ribonuclease Y [Kribbella solani]
MTAMYVGLALIGLLIAGLLAWIGLTLSRRKAAGTTAAQQDAVQRQAEQVRQTEEHAAVLRTRAEAAEQRAEEIRRGAEDRASEVRRDAEQRASDVRREAEAEAQSIRDDLREQRLEMERREHRLTEREERLDEQHRGIEERQLDLTARLGELDRRRSEIKDLEDERRRILEGVANLTTEQAKAELVAAIEAEAKRHAHTIVRDIERQAQDEGEIKARKIITGAVQRLASEQTSESVVSVVHLPSDDMKGRIIGREGRNIRSFEQTTGVNLIIDDTPEAVLLSCFDPVRRETARLTLDSLVLDGRIHPSRIEEIYERSKGEVAELCERAAEDAMAEVGITDLHPELVRTMGLLRYRTSYGQNVLKHLIESAHIAGMMAAELGLDPKLCKRGAFLHDIGKALTHESEGSHAIVGAELARKYGENDDVVHCIEAHHNEVEVRTVEAVLTQAADAVSGGRPGARRESLEAYVQRLERLEEIAMHHDGVEKVFAMQAGREIRVMVLPDAVDDIAAQVMARDIAKQVEEELTYPGQIRVTVVRESRATEVAK